MCNGQMSTYGGGGTYKKCTPLGGFFGSFECRISDKQDHSELEMQCLQQKTVLEMVGRKEVTETQNSSIEYFK